MFNVYGEKDILPMYVEKRYLWWKLNDLLHIITGIYIEGM